VERKAASAACRKFATKRPTPIELVPAGVATPLKAVMSPDLSTSSNGPADGVAAASSPQLQSGGWVGEVDGLPGALSVVILLHGPGIAVYGSVRFWDEKAGGMRAFRVSGRKQIAGNACQNLLLQLTNQ
jgi:hypothetical protein